MLTSEKDVNRWNAWNDSGGPRYPHEKVVQFCFRNYPATERGRVRALDMGCGGGVHTTFLAREGFRVTAYDLSPTAIETTRQRLAHENLSAELHVSSLEAGSFQPASFDLVICSGVFDACGPRVAEATLRKLPSLLAPGARGLFIFAGERDLRIQGENPFALHGYSRLEVESIFSSKFSNVWIDEYISTYENGKREQFDWLVTIFA